MSRRPCRVVLFLPAALAVGVVFGQIRSATITGTATDPSGALIATSIVFLAVAGLALAQVPPAGNAPAGRGGAGRGGFCSHRDWATGACPT